MGYTAVLLTAQLLSFSEDDFIEEQIRRTRASKREQEA
jgi:hypothetical protein